MAGMSTTGDVVKTGKMFADQSKRNQRRGPSNKNLASGATRRPNAAPTIRSISMRGGKKGPDHGAGGM